MHYGYVYKTTDEKTGCVYIGQHTNAYVRKYQKLDENYFGSGKIIQNILKKHGTKYLSCEILIWCDSKEELNIKEQEFVAIYKEQFSQKCYNIAKGGEGNSLFYKGAEEKALIKAKELRTKNNKSDEYKRDLANRIRNTLINKDPEEKARISKQHSETWFAKPQYERDLREEHRRSTRESWTTEQQQQNSDACRKAKERPVIVTDGCTILEFESALKCSKAFGWADCMAGMYIRKYSGIIKKKKSQYYGWKIYYKDQE